MHTTLFCFAMLCWVSIVIAPDSVRDFNLVPKERGTLRSTFFSLLKKAIIFLVEWYYLFGHIARSPVFHCFENRFQTPS